MKNLFAFLFGGLFALGLMVSGMSNPAKVLGFLDVFGDWDISLMFVMIGAIAVAIIPFQKAIRHPKTLLGETMLLPNNTQIDQKLMIGAVLFGIGWGWAGYCPGPAIAGLAAASREALWFVPAMVLGFWAHDRFVR